MFAGTASRFVRSTTPASASRHRRTGSRILAVGDSLRTDIAGAAGRSIDSLLIAGGIHAEEFGRTGERLPISGASKPPCARAVMIRSVLPGASAGSGTSVTAFVKYCLPQPCCVVEA